MKILKVQKIKHFKICPSHCLYVTGVSRRLRYDVVAGFWTFARLKINVFG